MKATQPARLHLAGRMEDRIEDYEWLKELWNNQPQTNHNHPFGMMRAYIVRDKLYGLSKLDCSFITQTLIKLEDNNVAKNLLINKLK